MSEYVRIWSTMAKYGRVRSYMTDYGQTYPRTAMTLHSMALRPHAMATYGKTWYIFPKLGRTIMGHIGPQLVILGYNQTHGTFIDLFWSHKSILGNVTIPYQSMSELLIVILLWYYWSYLIFLIIIDHTWSLLATMDLYWQYEAIFVHICHSEAYNTKPDTYRQNW